MNTQSIIVAILCLCCVTAGAQDSIGARKIIEGKTYQVKILSGKSTIHAYFRGLQDSSLVYSSKKAPFSRNVIPKQGETLMYYDIQSLGFREKGRVFKGIWIGALAGMAAGAAIGAIAYKKPKPSPGWNIDLGQGLSVAAGGSFGAIGGAILGGALRSKRIKFKIRGNKAAFDNMKEIILRQ